MTTEANDAGSPRTLPGRLLGWVRSDRAQAALLLLLEIAAFLWTPLSRYDEVYFSSADLTQSFSLTRIVPGHQPGNQLQSDAVTQMQPWSMFDREELAAGRVPLWNPWNGAGCPHFANFQSAVFSIFTAPFYLFDFKAALLLSAALKLFALGFFTYLFLREIGLRHLAALIGATIFTFAGHNTLLLYFPHVGALVALPGGLYFVEVLFKRFARARSAGERASVRGPLVGLTLVLLAGLLAGNPEPFYFAALLVGAYAMFRAIGAWRECANDSRAKLDLAGLLGKLVLACAVAAGLAAFQILPFFEYLRESRVLEQRSFRQTPLETTWWPLMLFPDVLGNPASPYKLSDNVPPPNYELVIASYVGGAAILFACLSVCFVRRDRYALFFALAGATWVVYAYDLFGAADLFMKIPTLDMAPMNRSQGLWNFIVACAAAITVEHVSRAEGRRRWLPVVITCFLGAALLVIGLVGADHLIASFATYESPNHKLFLQYVPQHIRSMCAIFASSIAVLALLWIARGRIARGVALSGLIVCTFLPTGWLLHDYNPIAENRFFFPVTPAIASLQSKVGDQRLAILGEDMIPPASNIPYHLDLVSNYDGMWVRDYDFLYRKHFGEGNNWRPILSGTKRSLQIFGVQYVLAKWGWNFLDDGLREFQKGAGLKPERREILPDSAVSQTFRARDNGLRAVMVHLSTFKKQTPCDLHFKLEDLDANVVVAERTLTSAEIQGSVYSKMHVTWSRDYLLTPRGRPVVFRFDPQPASFKRNYKITLTCAAGTPGDTICAWSMPVNGYGEGTATQGGKQLAGELLFDWSYDGDEAYEPIGQIDDYVLYRFRQAMPEFALVGGVIVAQSDEEALATLLAPEFDPLRLVVLRPVDESALAHTGNFSRTDNSQRRIVTFDDADWCYVVGTDGKTLAHITDEVTFLANKFDWKNIERLPAARRTEFTIIPDDDLQARKSTGLRLVNSGQQFASQLEVLEHTPTRIRLHVKRKEPAFLVISQAYFPGWNATLDGESVHVYRANYAFTGVEIPPGDFELDLRYEPASLRNGLWIGLASLVVGLGSLFVGRLRRAR